MPTGGQVWQVGFTLPGVVQVGRSDVGGAGGIQQTRMSAHGSTISDTTTQLDGMITNSMHGWAQSSRSWNDAAIQEMAFQTSNLGAESQTGGILLNLIPQQGGNQFKGDIDARSIPNDSFQGNNMTPELQKLGVSTPNKVLRLHDYSFSIGGPVKRDLPLVLQLGALPAGRYAVAGRDLPRGQQGKDFLGSSHVAAADEEQVHVLLRGHEEDEGA